ncbi:molybdenum cofactor biosynthesis protein MoaE [Aurantiacibacter gangjinensis]|uniref:Molybdopterin synthase catalytic subunit n=1 Tax=Aurantiacibacter gangjinensis TaxID=502682 RepID=A0A0G9MMY8_9SPHN|nr:molybdenum cofactor biosynthesis protein MoaE [Aurantiacibacter gangjinensis]APE28212.1 Molybdenum cofactor biosynthesis protein MoaE [Aurantiacibacter gangjinensis]KLE32111.1 molybdopterin converting factor [Aurantiacibacter gangjinensis]
MARDIALLEKGFSAGKTLGLFAKAHPEAGAIASFVGKVRPDGDVKVLHLTHYAPLTLPGMETLAEAASERWPLDGLLMHHRIGHMRPGAPIVLVAAAAAHRRAAFDAVDFCMDHLKARSWFWKREKRSDGWHWIEPHADDYAHMENWDV